ncbi:MAG TPA: hemolysin family protein [Anaerolineae bacterium]|nr:hemolysin family protein [Anaerolineae bacterium]
MTLPEVALFLFLLVANGFLATARSALVNVRKARLKQLIEEGSAPARAAERLAEDASRLLATAQLGMMLTSFLAGGVVAAISAPHVTRAIEPWLGDAAYPVAFIAVVFAAAWIMLILGELVPEMVGATYSERLALWLARPLALISILVMPVVRLTVWIANGVARLFGSDVRRELPFVTEEEIKTLVDAGEEEGVIQEEEKEMIYSIFELGDTLAREVMVPRIDVVALDEDTPMLDALGTIMEAGFSRIPVFRETIDNILGVLYTKDLLPYLRDGRTDVPLNKILRTAYFVPETKKASDLLPDLQQRRVHMAVVVDEYGGMAGLVTIEDLLEEIVGEIQDEYDSEEPFVQFISEDEYVVDARVDLDDLNRLMDVSLPTEESDTLGGFIYSELGKVPVVGDQVSYNNLDFRVESVAGRRIKKVRVQRVAPVRPAGGEVPGSGPADAGEAHADGGGNGNGNGNGKRRWNQ